MDPRLDTIHACAVRVARRRGILHDVVLKGVFPNSVEELITPPIVVAGVKVEDDRNKTPNVLHSDCLGMKVGDGGHFMQKQGLMKVVVVGDVIVLIGGVVVVVRCIYGSAFGVSQGVASTCCSGFALQSCGLGFSLGGSIACQGSIARCFPGGRMLARSGVNRSLHLGVGVQG